MKQMKQIIQLNEEQFNVISNDLAEIVYKLDGGDDDTGVIKDLQSLVSELQDNKESTFEFLELIKNMKEKLDKDAGVNRTNESLLNVQNRAIKDSLNEAVKNFNDKYRDIDLEIVGEKTKIQDFILKHENDAAEKLKDEVDKLLKGTKTQISDFKSDLKIDKKNQIKSLKMINFANLGLGAGLGLVAGVISTFFLLSSHISH